MAPSAMVAARKQAQQGKTMTAAKHSKHDFKKTKLKKKK